MEVYTCDSASYVIFRNLAFLMLNFENRWPDASFKEKDGEGCIIHEKGRNWHEKHYLLPLPTDQLKLNSNLKQNPGWNQ